MSTVLRWIDRLRQSSMRTVPYRHCSLVKSIILILVVVFIIGLMWIFNHSTVPIKKNKASLFRPSLQSYIISKINVSSRTSPMTLPAAPNYLDPFIYSRIEFTHDDQQRPETSRKWCQTQSKAIRTQDLELFKCNEIKDIPLSEHVFCQDLLVRNSCLIMSFGMGQNQLENPLINYFYDWGQCRIFTFDPYQTFKSTNKSDRILSIKPKWMSYRFGLTASAAVDDHSNLMTIEKLAEFIHLDSFSARIDLMIIDIDNANEWNLLDDNDFFLFVCRHVKQLIVKTKPIYSKRFQHYRVFTLKLIRCFSLLRRRSRLYLLGRHNQLESEWSLTNFSLNLGLFCDEIDMSMYLLVYGHLYLVNSKL